MKKKQLLSKERSDDFGFSFSSFLSTGNFDFLRASLFFFYLSRVFFNFLSNLVTTTTIIQSYTLMSSFDFCNSGF